MCVKTSQAAEPRNLLEVIDFREKRPSVASREKGASGSQGARAFYDERIQDRGGKRQAVHQSKGSVS